MRLETLRKRGKALMTGLMLGALALTITPTLAAPFNGTRTQFVDQRFNNVWTRTDAESVRGGRTWYWGPGPWFDYAEFYRQSPNGLRTVQYFDKARMEINNPSDSSGPNQGATNGLLVKELISGRVQLGNDPYDYDTRTPADVPVAGNPRDSNSVAPGYSAFAGVATIENSYRDSQRLGERIATTIDRGGNLGLNNALALPETTIVQYNSVTGHNIPQVFWDFMNMQGRIVNNGQVSNGPVVDWLFAMGLPLTDAYWTRAQIGGTQQDVLVQLFERRVLTYVPSNPAGYKVEMGNVGQHYFQWRYPHLGTPWASAEPNLPLLYASDVDTAGDHWELYTANNQGGGYRITRNSEETVAFSWRRSWDPTQVRLLVDSRRSNANYRQIYAFNPVAFTNGDYAPNAGVTRLSYTDGTPPPNNVYQGYLPNGVANDFNASYSPDGTKIIFASDRNGSSELFITTPGMEGMPTQLTNQSCVNETPTWSPDGRQIYWSNNCDGDFDIYRADLRYQVDSIYSVAAELINVTKLTNNNSDDRYVRVSPDGNTLAFSSNRDGNWEVYTSNTSNGANERRLTNNSATDDAPTWSADGRTLAFSSDRDGDFDIYTMDLNGNNVKAITVNNAQDRWALWAQ